MKKLFLFFIDGIGLCQKESPLFNLFTNITGRHLVAGSHPDFFDSGVFFEYFMTDIYGHKRNNEGLEEIVNILNRFTETTWIGIKNNDTSILIISDHGNAEDLTTGNHTFNNVPAILLTENKQLSLNFAESIHSLVDIYPWVVKYFT